MEENHQETEATTDICKFEDRKCKFKLAVYKFMLHEKQNMHTEYFKFEELKNSTFLSKYTEDEIKFWIKNTTEFIEDDEGNVFHLTKD